MPNYARPQEPHLVQEKQPIEGACPSCDAEDLRRYPVNAEGGWFIVVKCQSCFHSMSRERWRRLGPLELLSDSI